MSRSASSLTFSAVLALIATACGSSHSDHSTSSGGNSSMSSCLMRADPLGAGLSKTSKNRANFELLMLAPSVPVQSVGPPGNHWTLRATNATGAPLSGALNVTTYMPDHGHAGPPTLGIETEAGVYDIENLVFPMPALYAVTLGLTSEAGVKESVAIYVCVEAASG